MAPSHGDTNVQVLSPLLQEEELHGIFSRLASLYSKNLAEAFLRIEDLVRTRPWIPATIYPYHGK